VTIDLKETRHGRFVFCVECVYVHMRCAALMSRGATRKVRPVSTCFFDSFELYFESRDFIENS